MFRIYYTRRHSQVAKAEDCKSSIPGSNPGAALIKLCGCCVFGFSHNGGIGRPVEMFFNVFGLHPYHLTERALK